MGILQPSNEQLEKGRKFATSKLDDVRINYRRRIAQLSFSSKCHSYDGLELMLITYKAVKEVCMGSLCRLGVPVDRNSFANAYSLYIGACESLEYMVEHTKEEKAICIDTVLPFDADYSLIEAVIKTNIRMIGYAATGDVADSITKYFFSWLKRKCVAKGTEYEEFRRWTDENPIKINSNSYSGFALEQENLCRGMKQDIAKFGIKPVNFSAYNGEYVSLDMVGGQKSAKQEAAYLIAALKDKDSYRKFGLKKPRGIFFSGPPGTGKTLIGRAIACEVNEDFYYFNIADILRKYVGESENILKEILRTKGIVFLDEFDSIGRENAGRNCDGLGDVNLNLVNVLASEMDGFYGCSDNFVIAATNNLSGVARKLLRPGRFYDVVYFYVPQRDEIEEIFAIHLRNAEKLSGDRYSEILGGGIKRVCDAMYEASVKLQGSGGVGFVGDDIRAVVERALKQKHREYLFSGEKKLPTVEDFLNAVELGYIRNKNIIEAIKVC